MKTYKWIGTYEDFDDPNGWQGGKMPKPGERCKVLVYGEWHGRRGAETFELVQVKVMPGGAVFLGGADVKIEGPKNGDNNSLVD